MRQELTKLSTEGYGQPPPPHSYEEMTKAKWIQTAKDVPVVLAGSALGYGLGRTAGEYLVPKMFQSAEAQSKLKGALPWVAAGASGLGSYIALVQHRMLKERREAAEAQALKEQGGTSTAESELPQQTPAGSPTPKMGGAKVPNVGPMRTDPWRPDRRYPNYTGPR